MNRFLFPTMLALTGMIVTACGDDDDDDDIAGTETDGATTTGPEPTTTTTGPEPTTMPPTTATTTGMETTTGMDTEGAMATVRVVHASPNAGAVDVYIEGMDAPVIEALEYTQTTDYLPIPAGSYNFQVRPAGADPSEEPVYETGLLPLPGGVMVTAVAAGLVGAEAEDEAFRILPLIENFTDPGEGNAVVRVVHASPDAPTVGIDVGDDDPTMPEVTGLERFAATEDTGVPLPADMPLQVGIAADDMTVTAFSAPALPAGAELFVIATGLLGDVPRAESGFGLLAVGPDGTIAFIRQNPFVYALHGAWDAGEVDVCSGTTELIGDFAYGQLEPVQVPPGDYPLSILPGAAENCEGADPVLSTAEPLSLEAGEQYLAIAAGEVDDDPALSLIVTQEQFTLDSGQGAVRAIHAAGAPTVDVGLVDDSGQVPDAGAIVIEDLMYTMESDELLLDPNNYDLGLVPDEANPTYPRDAPLTFALDVNDQTRAWAVATGLFGSPQTPLTIRTIDTTTRPWTLVD